MSERRNLPKGWKWASIPNVVGKNGLFLDGDWIESKDQDVKGDVRLIQLADIGDGNFRNKSSRFLTSKRANELRCTFLSEGDILVARMPDPIGRACIFPLKGRNKYVTAVDVAIIRTEEEIVNNKYLLYSINNLEFRNSIEDLQSGTTRKRISRKNLSILEFPLPPKPTQLAIVSKIEELFSELDKGIEQLKAAQLQLKTYRKAVLKWAFEGKLTNENVKDGELPEGWRILKLKELAEEISDGDHQAPPKSTSGVPFITISNINKDNNRIDFSDTFSVNKEYYVSLKINRKPLKGDVLYTVTGSFGIPIFIDFEKEFCFQRHIGLIRPLEPTKQKWLYYLLQSPKVYNQAKSTATGTAQKTVALSSLRNFEVPFCSKEEQAKIVQEIESRLSVADKMEESTTQSLQQAEALRQSILKKAFEGRLV